MRGKSCSMDGLPDFTPSSFYVPGERHENLPINTFAGQSPYATMAQQPDYATLGRSGMGAPVQTLWADKSPPEYATGGSGMFQGADFGSGHGKLIALRGPGRRIGMGQDADSGDGSSGTSLSSVLNSATQLASSGAQIAQAISPGQAVNLSSGATAAPATSFLNQKIAGIPMVALLAAAAGVGAFFYMRKKK